MRAVVLGMLVAGCVTKIDVATPADVTGATAPPFSLVAQDTTTVSLEQLIAKDHVVLVFYRGHW